MCNWDHNVHAGDDVAVFCLQGIRAFAICWGRIKWKKWEFWQILPVRFWGEKITIWAFVRAKDIYQTFWSALWILTDSSIPMASFLWIKNFYFCSWVKQGIGKRIESWCLLLKGNKTSVKWLFYYLASVVNMKEGDFPPGHELWGISLFFSPLSLPNYAASIPVGFCSCSTTKLFFKALRHVCY